MKIYGFIFYISALFALIMSIQVNVDGDIKTMRLIKSANEFAVHDAAIPISITNIAQGRWEFDEVQGRQNYIEAINTKLKTTYNGVDFIPNDDSFLQMPVELLYLEFVDASHPSCPSFPCSFNVPIVNKTENLSGPSVLAILQTETPRYFPGDRQPIRRLSIYEYK